MRNSVIGIAGYMGCGKSMCASFMQKLLDAYVIDADAVAKQLMQTEPEIRRMLVQSFGDSIFDKHQVDFSTLGKRVFSDEERLLRLNAIVHPFLLDRLWELVRENNDRVVVLDAALISYWRIEAMFDYLIWVDASESLRVKRLEQKTDLSIEQIRSRMQSQQSLFTIPRDKRWQVLENEQSPDDLREKVEKFIQRHEISKGA